MQSAQFQLHAEIEQRHWWFVARRKILRELIGQVLPPGGRVVDVGCGTGANLAALSQDYDCVGLDSSAEAVALAQSRFSGPRFFHVASPADLARGVAGAQLVLLTDVLEHVPDDYGFFAELLRAVAPGTYLLITVPADMQLWSAHDESFGHYRRYDLTQLCQVWEGLPVTPLLTSYFNTRLYPAIKLIRGVNRLRNRTLGQAGTDFTLPSWPINSLLSRTFAGEARRLTAQLQGRRPCGYRRGVSLVALLRREPGTVLRPSRSALGQFDSSGPPTSDLAAAQATLSDAN